MSRINIWMLPVRIPARSKRDRILSKLVQLPPGNVYEYDGKVISESELIKLLEDNHIPVPHGPEFTK